MKFEEFALKLDGLSLSIPERALSILWFHDEESPDFKMTAGELSRIIHRSGLGNPHSTQLTNALKKSGLVVQQGSKFSLKSLSRAKIRTWLEPILGTVKPSVDQDLGFLPAQVWKGTRDYIEKVASQLNGCFQFGFYDATSVLVRRLTETLLIESFEQLKRDREVKDGNGHYLMLNGLIDAALGASPVGLGRDAERSIRAIKELGDRSAHNRRFCAVKADLEKIQSGVRVTVDELISIARLRRPY